jgi:hypothetical protein
MTVLQAHAERSRLFVGWALSEQRRRGLFMCAWVVRRNTLLAKHDNAKEYGSEWPYEDEITSAEGHGDGYPFCGATDSVETQGVRIDCESAPGWEKTRSSFRSAELGRYDRLT